MIFWSSSSLGLYHTAKAAHRRIYWPLPHTSLCCLQPLIEHLATQYVHRFSDVDYVDTFKFLAIKFEQQQVSPTAQLPALCAPTPYKDTLWSSLPLKRL